MSPSSGDDKPSDKLRLVEALLRFPCVLNHKAAQRPFGRTTGSSILPKPHELRRPHHSTGNNGAGRSNPNKNTKNYNHGNVNHARTSSRLTASSTRQFFSHYPHYKQDPPPPHQTPNAGGAPQRRQRQRQRRGHDGRQTPHTYLRVEARSVLTHILVQRTAFARLIRL